MTDINDDNDTTQPAAEPKRAEAARVAPPPARPRRDARRSNAAGRPRATTSSVTVMRAPAMDRS